MTPFIWKSAYQIGSPKVDQQHQQLFALTNQLVQSISQPDLINNVMQLYKHVREHFKAEEALMEERGYPDKQQHVDTHNLMLDKLVEVSERIHKHKWQQQDVLEFMKEWISHIIEEDVAISNYIQTQQRDNPSGYAGNG